jgi:hypothetical protein
MAGASGDWENQNAGYDGRFVASDAISAAGGKLLDSNPDGTLNVEDPNGNVQKFDPIKHIKGLGGDPSRIKIEYNRPDTPVDKNALSFSTGALLAEAGSEKDQLKVLQNVYGADSVVKSTDGFNVKENGLWKKADTTFLERGFANKGMIGGAAIGYNVGAGLGGLIGAATNPIPGMGAVGAWAGGAIGASIGGMIGKWTDKRLAEQDGVRTEADADHLKTSLGNEFAGDVLTNAAIGVLFPAAIGTGKFLAGEVGAVGKRVMKPMVDAVAATDLMQNILSKVPRETWLPIFRDAGEAKMVRNLVAKEAEFTAQEAAGLTEDAVSPATGRTLQVIKDSLNSFKDMAYKAYNKAQNTLAPYLENKTVEMAPVANKFNDTVKAMGLIDKAGEFNPAGATDEVQRIFDPTALSALKKVHGLLESYVVKPLTSVEKSLQQIGGLSSEQAAMKKIPWADAQKILHGLDDILESSGYYSGGEMSINSTARANLKSLRVDIANKFLDALGKDTLDVEGKQVLAADYFRKMKMDYHNFRNVYDDFAGLTKGGDQTATLRTVNKMLGPNGELIEQSFGQLANSVGQDATPALRELQRLRSAKNLNTSFSSQGGTVQQVKQWLGFTPKNIIAGEGAVGQLLDPVKLSQRIQAARQNSAPLSTKSFVELKALSQTADFVKGLGTEAKQQLFSDPTRMGVLLNSLQNASSTYDKTQQVLDQNINQVRSGQ